jgi:hypothetical protein
MGYVDGKYMLFATEGDYIEYMKSFWDMILWMIQ